MENNTQTAVTASRKAAMKQEIEHSNGGDLLCHHNIRVRDLTNQPLDHDYDNVIRVYGGSAMGAVIQLRAFGPITDSKNAKPRQMIATADYIGRKQIRAIIEKLTEIEQSLWGAE